MQLLLGTNNPGKLKELRALLADLPLKLVNPREAGLSLKVKETGKTYRENAILKAAAFAEAAGVWTLADDSGLEVEILDGAPGLYSSRYAAWPDATDADRRAVLLENLRGHERPWIAQFRCTIALCGPEGTQHITSGICPGEIVPEERGSGGFGYDPIFLVGEEELTMAELGVEKKNTLSHRGRAVQKIIPILQEIAAKSETAP